MRNLSLIPPYGGKLVDLRVPDDERAGLIQRANELPSVQLSCRSLCDLELLATGAFSPLDRFMGQLDYTRTLEEMRLSNGFLFSIPITLPIANPAAAPVGREVCLRNSQNQILATMLVEEVYQWDPNCEAQRVLGTIDARHPLVAEMSSWGRFYISGPLKVLQLPVHYDFVELRRTPLEVRKLLEQLGRANVIAFQTGKLIHRLQEEFTKRAAERVQGTLLLHPSVGMTKVGDLDYYTRVRTYKLLADQYYDSTCTLLTLLPLAIRRARSREVIWHAMIERNYGANYFIAGSHHADPGKSSQEEPFYYSYEAWEQFERYSGELEVKMIPYKDMAFLPDEGRYEEADLVQAGTKALFISGTQVRDDYLAVGRRLPDWFTRPEVAETLGEAFPPRHKRGFCIWFTGVPSAGKSTIAEVLTVLLMQHGRQVTILDGDIVRTHLSKGLGFSKQDRDINVLRIGFVASEIVRHEAAVVCAAVSPYRDTRKQVRTMVGADRFIEVFVDTPIGVCEQRDVKGLYARARSGELKSFTGIDDPYEVPIFPEITLRTTCTSPEDNAYTIVRYLMENGFLKNKPGFSI